METIGLLVTGGTLDKVPVGGAKLIFKDTHVSAMLAQARCEAPVEVESLMLLDSLDMTDSDRARIAAAVAATAHRQVVVTHGTDTLALTAEAIVRSCGGRTVVLCGAMVPFSCPDSDALFNLGAALTAVQLLPPGVHVAMHGCLFAAGRVRKNLERGRFEAME